MSAQEPSQEWSAAAVLAELQVSGSQENRAGMARFGIDASSAFGVPMSVLRPLARRIGMSPQLADELWETGRHEARLLAILLTPPESLAPDRAMAWMEDIRSWDLCDQFANVLARRPGSDQLVPVLVADEREFVRRAGFALMAWRAVHAKTVPDTEFLNYLNLIRAQSTDERNFVWKAVHWALRQIGKRSAALHDPALDLSRQLCESQNKTSRRIGREAQKELSSEKVLTRLKKLPEP
ncbi:DNA alkylation repair protein [Roseibium salinum]|uniref:DNA alkylation repair protein n=1 Tax=Roseibium salinum TaxID=1604349 RepID=A0ABT3R1A1_9HYPH|nr:DNA alkylation repair protein [Roseibium sp. DSM 29163]MCX2723024.1 DNA alkylation repair protein [Roseibium sp. DSM 29163]